MGISTEYNYEQGMAIHIGAGMLTQEEILGAILDSYAQDDFVPRLSCWDFRNVSGEAISADAIDKIRQVAEQCWAKAGIKGKTAIVAEDKLVFALSRMMELSSGKQNRDIMVFTDKDEAVTWLNSGVE